MRPETRLTGSSFIVPYTFYRVDRPRESIETGHTEISPMPMTGGQSGRMAAVEPAEKTSQRAALIYAAMVAGAVGLFVIIKTAGKFLSAPAQTGPVRFGRIAQAAASGELAHVLLALVIIIVFARGLGAVFKKI